MNILKISVQLQNQLDTSMYFELAVKCLTVFNSEQKADVEFVFRNLIFSTRFYPSDVLIRNLNIEDTSKNLLTDLQDIFEVYAHVLGFKSVSNSAQQNKINFD